MSFFFYHVFNNYGFIRQALDDLEPGFLTFSSRPTRFMTGLGLLLVWTRAFRDQYFVCFFIWRPVSFNFLFLFFI
jgi:hypothetical protein